MRASILLREAQETVAPSALARSVSWGASMQVIHGLYSLMMGVILGAANTISPLPHWNIVVAVYCGLGVFLLACAIFLYSGRKVGRILSWVVFPVAILNLPFGTILTVIAMWKIEGGKQILR